jgi:hypothetical protein
MWRPLYILVHEMGGTLKTKRDALKINGQWQVWKVSRIILCINKGGTYYTAAKMLTACTVKKAMSECVSTTVGSA